MTNDSRPEPVDPTLSTLSDHPSSTVNPPSGTDSENLEEISVVMSSENLPDGNGVKDGIRVDGEGGVRGGKDEIPEKQLDLDLNLDLNLEVQVGIGRPRSKEDWDRFILGYATGQFNSSAFPLATPVEEKSPVETVRGKRSRDGVKRSTGSRRRTRSREGSTGPRDEKQGDLDSERQQAQDGQFQVADEGLRDGESARRADEKDAADAPPNSDLADDDGSRQVASSSLAASAPSEHRDELPSTPPSPDQADSPPDLAERSSEDRSGNEADIDAETLSADIIAPSAPSQADPQRSTPADSSSHVDSSDTPSSGDQRPQSPNQDPDIPNISTHDYAYRTPHPDRHMFREKEEGDLEQEDGLTRENMRRLDLQLQSESLKQRQVRVEARQPRVQLRRSDSRRSHRSGLESSGEEEGPRDQVGEDGQRGTGSLKHSSVTRRAPPRAPRSRGSLVAYRRSSGGSGAGAGGDLGDERRVSVDRVPENGSILLDSGTGSTTNSGEAIELDYDIERERERVRTFYEANGYMPAPRQTPENTRRRLRVIRRLGIENPGGYIPGLQRFTRLAATLLKAKMAMVSIIGKDKNWIIAAHGSDLQVVELESAFCAHTVVASGKQCLTVQDATQDWRFKKNPFVDVGAKPKDDEKGGEGGKGDEAGEGDDAKRDDDLGGVKFYAGSPLIIGKGPRAAIIGSLCLLDTTARIFKEEEKAVLGELADCVVSELELVYAQRASIESAKLHQISVDFLRRSLKSRPNEAAGKNRSSQTHSSTGSSLSRKSSKRTARAAQKVKNSVNPIDSLNPDSSAGALEDPTVSNVQGENGLSAVESAAVPAANAPQSSSNKRTSGADRNQSVTDIDIYDEACSEIRTALDAYAVAIVDLSQFHLFYPTFGGSSTAGSSTRKSSKTGTLTATGSRGPRSVQTIRPGQNSAESAGGQSLEDFRLGGGGVGLSSGGYSGSIESDAKREGRSEEGDDEYAHSSTRSKRARQTYALRDPTAPSRTPQVLYIPGGRKGPRATDGSEEELAVLGYSCEYDNFAFNFTSSPAAKKIISDFIAANVKNRQVWYTRDDSEGIAESINHLMPKGTETSLAMPVFGFDGQVAFAVVACWTDPLYTYPSGALQFVETIAGSLLASVMKERLHQAERAQLSFAAAASHELRTPLHQITAAATLLRSTLQPALNTPRSSIASAASSTTGLEGTAAVPSVDSTGLNPFTRAKSLPTDGQLASETAGSMEITSSARSVLSASPTSTENSRPVRPPLNTFSSEDRIDALQQIDIIETNSVALGTILENLIDTLDIGRLTSKLETRVIDQQAVGDLAGLGGARPDSVNNAGADIVGTGGAMAGSTAGSNAQAIAHFDKIVEDVLMESVAMEDKTRRVAGNKKGMDGIEVVLEVLPRSRGGWAMAQHPGALSRALGKIIHNACKFTQKGYVHVTVQDASRDVVLPAGYDNSIRTSLVSIDIKDSGIGMSPKFLEREVLRPFTKADSFTPGSGLGLGLAQRMIELLGGKLAIASEPNKGTLVHVEVPLHLYNQDNDSDQDEFAEAVGAGGAMTISGSADVDHNAEKIRQDGIYLLGFGPSPDSRFEVDPAALKRVGKSLLRQLKLNFCRVVPEISYASLIVVPEHIATDRIIDVCKRARPNVEVVIIGERQTSLASIARRKARPQLRRGSTEPSTSQEKSSNVNWENGANSNGGEVEIGEMDGFKVRKVYRPMRPSVMEEIMRPPVSPPEEGAKEQYLSPVVGESEEGRDERWSRILSRAGSIGSSRRMSGSFAGGSVGASRPHLRRATSAFTSTDTSDTNQAANTAGSRRTAGTAHTARTDSTMPDEIARSSVGSASSFHHRPDSPPPTTTAPDSTRQSITSDESPETSPKLGELRTLGPIPDAFRTIRTDFEDALPAIDHDTQRRESVSGPSTGRSPSGRGSARGTAGIPNAAAGALAPPAQLTSSSGSGSGAATGSSTGRTGLKSNEAVTPARKDEVDKIGGTGGPTAKSLSAVASASLSPTGTAFDGTPPSAKKKGKDKAGGDDGVLKNKLRVLVVEDNDVNRRILVTMLKRSSCEYAEAIDGFFAVDQFTSFRPHLVLLDINMPNKDGFQAASEMRALERRAARRHARRTTSATSPGSGLGDDGQELGMGMLSPKQGERPFASPGTDQGDGEDYTSARGGRGHSQEASGSSGAELPVSPRSQGSQALAQGHVQSPGSLLQSPEGGSIPLLMPARIIAVTAMSSEAHRRRGLVECGIDQWMAKPVQIQALKEEIKKCKEEMLGDRA